MKLRWLVLATLCATMHGQAVRYDGNVTQPASNAPAGASANVMTVPNAFVTICGYPAVGNPCTNTVPIWQDQLTTVPQTQPVRADSLGRFGFWITPGQYSYSVQTQSGKNVGNFPLSLTSPAGPAIPFLGVWSSSIAYLSGQLVAYNGLLYISVQNTNLNHQPDTSPSFWSPQTTAGTIASFPAGGQAVTQPSGTSLGANSLNNVLNATMFSGADIGTKINAAFAQCATTSKNSCVVTLQPNQTYTFATTINFPDTPVGAISTTYPTLDCNGAYLSYTGSSDALIVPPRSGIEYLSGIIRNCNFKATNSATSIIHTKSIIGLTMQNITLVGGGSTAACIKMENVNTTSGPLWSEQNTFNNIHISGCAKGMQQFNNGGTDSFEYNTWTNIHFELDPNQIGLSLEGNVFTIGTMADFRANTHGTPGNQARVVSATGGGGGSFNTLTIRGESDGTVTDCSVYTDSSSFISATGSTTGSNFTVCYGAGAETSRIQILGGLQTGLTNLQGSPDNGYELQAGTGNRGTPQDRNCKWDMLNGTPSTVSGVFQAGSALFGLANPSGFGAPNCFFEVYRRTTTAPFPDVNLPGASGNPVQSILYADSFTGNVGVGQGFGWNGTAFISPIRVLDVISPFNGSFYDIASFHTSSMTAGQQTCVVIGKESAAKNEARFCFNYNSSGSNLNYVNIGFPTVDGAVKVFADGTVVIPTLAGTGNALACVDATGKFYRGTATTCP